jgi:hypothetical protein
MAPIIGEAERDPLAAAPALTQERCGAIARAAAQAGAAAAARRPRGRGGRQGQGAGLRPGTPSRTNSLRVDRIGGAAALGAGLG